MKTAIQCTEKIIGITGPFYQLNSRGVNSGETFTPGILVVKFQKCGILSVSQNVSLDHM